MHMHSDLFLSHCSCGPALSVFSAGPEHDLMSRQTGHLCNPPGLCTSYTLFHVKHSPDISRLQSTPLTVYETCIVSRETKTCAPKSLTLSQAQNVLPMVAVCSMHSGLSLLLCCCRSDLTPATACPRSYASSDHAPVSWQTRQLSSPLSRTACRTCIVSRETFA